MMKQDETDIGERIEELRNCVKLKKQFAYEIYCRKGPVGMELMAKFEAAQLIARRIYPYDVTENAALYISSEWIKDPIVIDTFLQLENGTCEGIYLPNKQQHAMAILNLSCEIEQSISAFTGSKRSPQFKAMLSLRRACIENSKLMSAVMGWDAEDQA